MKKHFLLGFFLILTIVLNSRGADFNELVSNLTDKVTLGLDFTESRTVCVFEFVSLSPRSPSYLQNLYQLFLASLERKLKENILIEDEVVGFDENVGYFNLSEEKVYDYLFSLTYMEKEGKMSLSLKVFDGKEPERIIAFFYSSIPLNLDEIELIEKPISRHFSFLSSLYEPLYLPFSPLDVKFLKENSLVFLTEKKLLFYEIEGERLKISQELNLNWQKPIFYSQDLAGRIYFELINDIPVILADSSLSSSVIFFSFKNNQWFPEVPLQYIPLEKINIGNKNLLLGVKFREGMNHFKEKIALIESSSIVNDNQGIIQETKLVPFYDIIALKDEKGRFFGIYIIDTNGKLRFFNRFFRELKIPEFKVGDRLISIGNYIICSKFGRDEEDSILVISGRERNIIQEIPLKGHVISMAYNGKDTISIICKDQKGNSFLHLWRKK